MRMPETAQPTVDIDHGVTSENTVAHWVLYALDAIESQNPEQHREVGQNAVDVYEHASDENGASIVFRDAPEVRGQLKWLAEERDALDRRTDDEWVGDDPDWQYRLNEQGRNALLDLGVPEYLPNRRDPEFDRELPMEPSHAPGWWREDDDGGNPNFEVEPGWSMDDRDDWVAWSEESDRIFFKDAGDASLAKQRGYHKIAVELAEAFPEVTFVVTCGPHRPHDLMYRIRDPFDKVVQIDVYSPMALHRETAEITENIERLVRGLHRGLEQAGGDD